MAGPDDLDDLDDLLSSLDPVDPAPKGNPAVSEFDERPRTEMLSPPNAFDDDERPESQPPIRTPLPPSPPEVALPDLPEPVVAEPAPLPEPEAPLTLDPVLAMEGINTDDPVRPENRETTPLADDPESAFAMADAVGDDIARDAQAAAAAAAKRAREAEAPPISVADSGEFAAPEKPAFQPEKRGLPTIVWVAIVSFAVAALGAILYTQIDAFHPERQETRDRMAEGDKDRALEAHRRAQPIPGSVTITSSEEGAAVWLLLGRTPLQSIPLPSNQVHEVRFELLGRKTVDAAIDRSHWSTDGEQVATLSATLAKGRSNPPAYPAERAVKPPPGPPGTGILSLESTPPGARAWLLIGFSPEAKITGIETGRRYEFRVVKDGFLPSYTVVEQSDWSAGRTEATRQVKLVPAKTARK